MGNVVAIDRILYGALSHALLLAPDYCNAARPNTRAVRLVLNIPNGALSLLTSPSSRPGTAHETVSAHDLAQRDQTLCSGGTFLVTIEGERRADGTWGGRVVFTDATGSRRTGQETSQPTRDALQYWASGLEQVYLDGAFARAHDEQKSAGRR